MLQAILLGIASQSSLVLSGLAVYWVKVPPKVIGCLAGFGAGALISAIAYDLIPEGQELSLDQLAIWLLIGASIFVVSDRIIEAKFGDTEASGGPAPLGIVVGSVVDGVPESAIFGIQVASGKGISVAFLAAVFISNIPQALAPSADLAEKGWNRGRVVGMWGVVLLACGVAAGLGYGAANMLGSTGDRAAALAAGGLLAMLTNSLMPYAFEKGGAMAGVFTVVGFAVSMLGS
jgi:ZIP family zinc transporter